MDVEEKKARAFEMSLQLEALSIQYNQLKAEIIREMNNPKIAAKNIEQSAKQEEK